MTVSHNTEKMRIAKYLSHAGICSRRKAEALIDQGRITLNGKILDTPAIKVDEQDSIEVDGEPVGAPERLRLFLLHKKPGVLTTHSDDRGRPTLFEQLPDELPRLISIGRLDMNTEGLILLTNHGDLARHLESPRTAWRRKYKVRIYGDISKKQMEKLEKGIQIEKMRYAPIEIEWPEAHKSGQANFWVEMTLREGKNREIRNIIEHLGGQVNRLIRVSYGPFQLGGLRPGEVREVPPKALREQLPEEFRDKI